MAWRSCRIREERDSYRCTNKKLAMRFSFPKSGTEVRSLTANFCADYWSDYNALRNQNAELILECSDLSMLLSDVTVATIVSQSKQTWIALSRHRRKPRQVVALKSQQMTISIAEAILRARTLREAGCRKRGAKPDRCGTCPGSGSFLHSESRRRPITGNKPTVSRVVEPPRRAASRCSTSPAIRSFLVLILK